ncbi:MAG: DUF2161 family putative PD-(D/E)XK-type phosphodiesterase [Spirochaetaceae bacterium]
MEIPKTEAALYEPIRSFLLKRGYHVQGEVRGCDVVARQGEELIVVELKRSPSLQLLMQAVERQEYADTVYIALPVGSATGYPPNYRSLRRLLKRLELGLLLVRYLRGSVRVEIAFHPQEYRKRKKQRERRAIIREVEGRLIEGAPGGSATRDGSQRLTAYKQAAIHLAILLREYGPASPARLRELGGADRAQEILSRNYYGWFDKVDRGIYCLAPEGARSLLTFGEQIREIETAALEGARGIGSD